MKGKDLTPLCPYCGEPSKLVTGLIIYPHRPDLEDRWFYLCEKDNAYVGTHKGTKIPLGRLADADLRMAKSEAHSHFDPIWQTGKKTRKEAYQWLADNMVIDVKQCHIGEFDLVQCHKVIELCSALDRHRSYRTHSVFKK
jgi:hypothetical protein